MNKGIIYENNLKQKLKHILIEDDSGGFNSHAVDLQLKFKDQIINTEVKGVKSQMGETSFQYDTDFSPTNDLLDQSLISLIQKEALIPIKEDINALLKFFQNYKPIDFHQTVCRIPFRVTKQAWLSARNEGLLRPINKKIPFTTKMINDHYNKGKNCFYIQIEKQGLFYMGKNPLGLPIPELNGAADCEIRLKRSGSKINQTIREKVANVTLVVVGRLKCDIKSPYSLDNEQHVKELFNE